MENLGTYINHPGLLGKPEESRLLHLKEQYPYFQAVHVLLARAYKNQETFNYTQGLKLASLYAGDRRLLYQFIHRNEGLAEEEKPETNEVPLSMDAESESKMEAAIAELTARKPPVESVTPVPEVILPEEETIPEIFGETPTTVVQEEEQIQEVVREEKTEPEPSETREPEEVKEAPKPLMEEEAQGGLLEVTDSTASKGFDEGEEHDFLSWLDNFAIAAPPELEKKETGETEILAREDHDQAEEEEEGEKYDLADLAEMAYDIQAFVKNKEESKAEVKKPSGREEIDELLDRFIKKNPSISREKVALYKPENMARKSEEFPSDLVSESLAGLFYKQGNLHKSLEIYEKLILQKPEKRDIFAARIKTIREELINRL